MADVPANNLVEAEGYLDVLAKMKEMDPVYYVEMGSYQGTYLAILRDKDRIHFFTDSYGSCSGCDWYEAECQYSGPDYAGKRGIPYTTALEYTQGMSPEYIVPAKSITLGLIDQILANVQESHYDTFDAGENIKILEAIQAESAK